ncbi:MAG: hypothetical protein ACLUKN_06490 [Bacilli bacterium]
MKTKKEDILWKINSPDTLQLWPKSSRECYISPPFLPEEFVSDANGIFAPKNGSLDILGLYGIKNAAFTTHRSQYYSERVKKFPTIIYTLRGTAKVSLQEPRALKKSVFLSATGSAPFKSGKVLGRFMVSHKGMFGMGKYFRQRVSSKAEHSCRLRSVGGENIRQRNLFP